MQLIFSILTNKKCGLCEFKKVMFQIVARHFELIFCLFTSRKCDWGKSEKE